MDAVNSGPFRHSVNFSIGSNQSVIRAVVLLSRHINPPAIIGRIGFVVIYAVDTKTFLVSVLHRPIIEMLEPVTSEPFITNGYALAAVMVEHAVFWVIAPCFHIGICAVNGRSEFGIPEAARRAPFFLFTAAAHGVAASEIIARYGCFVSAIANALPRNFLPDVPARLDHGEFAKPLAS